MGAKPPVLCEPGGQVGSSEVSHKSDHPSISPPKSGSRTLARLVPILVRSILPPAISLTSLCSLSYLGYNLPIKTSYVSKVLPALTREVAAFR